MKTNVSRLRSSAPSLSLSSCIPVALALGLAACGGSESDGAPAAAGSGNGSDPPGVVEVGTMLASAEPCTEPHTICMNLQVPSTMNGTPVSLQFDIFDSASAPAHLPNGYAGIFRAPALTPGEQVHFELTDADLQGDYWMWVIMYMEGGGYGAPVSGVDYTMRSAPAVLHLDGTPLNIDEPVVLGL